MAIKPKYLLVGAIGLLSLSGAALYYQYTKLQETCVKFGKIVLNKISLQNINFDLTLILINKTKIPFTIHSQVYDVYVNDSFITKIQSNVAQKIAVGTPSPVTVNVNINPSDFKNVNIKITDLLSHRENVNIRVDVKLLVGLLFFKIAIPFTYTATLKDLTSGSAGTTQSKGNC